MKPSPRIEQLSRAVHPGLLDTAIDPHLMIVLIIANLMCPSLWRMRDRILDKIPREARNDGAGSQSLISRELLAYIDRHFTHLFPMAVAKQVGVLEIEDERRRLGAENVDIVKDQLIQHLKHRRSDGLLTPMLDIFPLLEQDQMPIYTYSTVDGLRGMARLLGHKKHRPLGVTVCADEATLTASLACILHSISFTDVFIIGSPGHYTTFLQKDGQRFWCNGKLEYFDEAKWFDLTQSSTAASPITEFERRMPHADRFISLFGMLKLGNGVSTIPLNELERMLDECDTFFGTGLPQSTRARSEKIQFLPAKASRGDLMRFNHLTGADQARALMAELAGDDDLSVFGQAIYCYRDIRVREPGAYLVAALRGQKLRAAAASIASIEDALTLVQGIHGKATVYNDRYRVALPDEVLLFETGDDVDRGLLLLSLLLAAPTIADNAKKRARLTVTLQSSYLTWQGQLIDLASLGRVIETIGETQMELSAPSSKSNNKEGNP